MKAAKTIWRTKPGDQGRRTTVVFVLFLAMALILGGWCVYIQGLDLAGNAAVALAPETQVLPATRGTITDRNGTVLAASVPAVNITADPTIVVTNGLPADSMSHAEQLRAGAGPGIIAAILTAYLGGDFQTYYDKLTTTVTSQDVTIRYVVLKTQVVTYADQQVSERLQALGYVGLFREQAPVRDYPNATLAANVVGFMTYSQELADAKQYPWTGGDGLEYALNASLAGVDGQEMYESSPYGKIPTGTAVVKAPQEGVSYQLTLDLGMQYMQDQRLAAAVQATGARSGNAITMNVKTGEILAMSTYPTFDPNDLSNASTANLGNRIVRDTYEPGSVEKVLTFAALVDQGLITPGTPVTVPSSIMSGDVPISDSWRHDPIQLTAAGVLANSSNIGTVVLARDLDKSVLLDYLTGFGLGQPTGIGLPGEAAGLLPDASMTNQTRDHIAFGQGLGVTAIQEAAAVATIARGGMYIAPTIIKSATTSDGASIPLPTPVTRRVIAEESARTVLTMMNGVTAYNAPSFDVPGYNTGGKSGTAEEINPACGCYDGGYVLSYVGVAPVEDPALLTYVTLDHPKGSSGTAVVAPIVRDIMRVALPRYGVAPSTVTPPELPMEW